MRKWNKLLALVLAMVMVFGLTATAFAEEDGKADDTTPTETTEPAEGEEDKTPAEGEDAEAPAEGEDAEAPAEGEDAETPAEGEDAEAPADDEDAAPADDEDAAPAAFTDVSSWAADAVATVVEKGLMSGVSETEFGGKTPITRAGLVVALYRLAESPANAEDAENPFPDVADDAYYAAAVIWANANGIVSGRTNGNFDPDASITRQEIAKVLFEYAKAENVEEDNISVFTDVDTIANWAKDYVNWAVASKLISGVKGMQNTVSMDPNGNATREQIAVILVNYIENVLSAAPAEGDDAQAPAEGEDAETPAEGEDAETPAEGEETPAEGEEAPAEGEETPAEGEEAPAEGEETPAEGEEAPAEGDAE